MVADVHPERVKKLPTGGFGEIIYLSSCPDQSLILKVIHVWRLPKRRLSSFQLEVQLHSEVSKHSQRHLHTLIDRPPRWLRDHPELCTKWRCRLGRGTVSRSLVYPCCILARLLASYRKQSVRRVRNQAGRIKQA